MCIAGMQLNKIELVNLQVGNVNLQATAKYVHINWIQPLVEWSKLLCVSSSEKRRGLADRLNALHAPPSYHGANLSVGRTYGGTVHRSHGKLT